MVRIYTICSLLCLFVLSGCNNWLDLKPYGEVEENKLFESEEGFIQTLSGSYLLLTSSSAYGRELTVGFPEEIVHYWNKRSEFYVFDYANTDVVSRLDATWLKMYEAIANTNLLLQNLEGKDKADFEHYDLIKGEALGLRAYLHLDLLRLYGPVLKDGGWEQKSIPYREEFSNRTVQLMKASEVISRIQRDLDSAYVLLAEDPIKRYGRDEYKYAESWDNPEAPEVKGLAFSYRGCRMNYYAVCATLARLHLLKGDRDKALKYATEVIENGVVKEWEERIFQLADDMDIDEEDYMFERELVWSLYDPSTQDNLVSKVKSSDYGLDGHYQEYVYTDNQSYGSEEDVRSTYWFKYSKTSPAYWYLSKYDRTYSTADKSDKTPWRTMVPMIRLSEMYYIAAEANLETNPAEAYRLLNEVRYARNLSDLPSTMENNADELRNQIFYEYRKEFWGEGKLFYFYKRLFLDIQTREEVIPARDGIYVLPVPRDEMEFGDNH